MYSNIKYIINFFLKLFIFMTYHVSVVYLNTLQQQCFENIDITMFCGKVDWCHTTLDGTRNKKKNKNRNKRFPYI